MMKFLFFLISFSASIIGGICGIGGGVVVKPVLDALHVGSASEISFLSSGMVLSMSLYNVGKSLSEKTGAIELRMGTPLAIGAAVGGVLGNRLFRLALSGTGNDGLVKSAQALGLLALVVGTMLYTLNKRKIRPLYVTGLTPCCMIGSVLGLLSSFLGIGGGPFNLVFLHYFLGLETKRAAENSLYIILFSQATNLAITVCSRAVPEFSMTALFFMVLGGILGGVVGRGISKRLDGKAVDRLFILLLIIICAICVYNAGRGFSA